MNSSCHMTGSTAGTARPARGASNMAALLTLLVLTALLTGCPSANTPSIPMPPSASVPPPSGSSGGQPSSSQGQPSSGESSQSSENEGEQTAGTGQSGGEPGLPGGGGIPGQEGSGGAMPGKTGSGRESRQGQRDGKGGQGDDGELVMNEGKPGGMDGAEGENASEALPDFSEDEALETSMEDFEDAMETAAADAQGQDGQQGQGRQGGNQPPGGWGGDDGTLTDSEQVAILDEQLERGTGEFDDLILRERDTIRRTAKGGSGRTRAEDVADDGYGGYGGGTDESNGYEVPPMAGRGGGGGMGGGAARPDYDPEMPEDVAMYEPPEDIPDGDDDDVVARQLREAAMREPDPELREKLWDEYRKYKGID